MSPVLHIDATPRVPGCLNGHAPKTYPGARICATPGCGTFLSVYNAGPVCDPCQRTRRQKEDGVDHVSDAEVLAELVTGEYVSGAAIGKALGIGRNAVNKHVKNLRLTGWHIEATPRKGMLLVDVKPKDAPDGPSGAAPVIPPPEQPADVEAAPMDLPPQVGPPPFAGIDVRTSLEPPPFAGIDYELVVISDIVRRIESLTGHETRLRVAAYVAARFL